MPGPLMLVELPVVTRTNCGAFREPTEVMESCEINEIVFELVSEPGSVIPPDELNNMSVG
jgi:hypothetical protein